ncbi:DUF6476 family protein [Actibacterium sp. 188UL27-1]|uniref:DUF6476 family protein n=1 Tax=Actibacterium sp. 188UL27-1 TaxID=2786961 RepID=UPI00195D9B87|nr:DUF6476 family protein [Actibacterium sp. 188UL27-1]MBM7069202.1 hypothetical protein [Actibacterium sp. 188UL27-1]
MADTPDDGPTPGTLRFLKVLVTGLTAIMALGMVTLVVLFITRFPGVQSVPLPDTITLPDGATATAFTTGPDWYAVVTAQNQILIFDRQTGAMRQEITIRPQTD